MDATKRALLYFDADGHRTLQLRASACNRSISDMVNKTVRVTLAEDADDLREAEQREAAQRFSLEEFATSLRVSGTYSLTIKSSAVREPQKVSDKATQSRLIEKVKSLATQPQPSGAEKLASGRKLYRVCQGNTRIIYSVDDHSSVINI